MAWRKQFCLSCPFFPSGTATNEVRTLAQRRRRRRHDVALRAIPAHPSAAAQPGRPTAA